MKPELKRRLLSVGMILFAYAALFLLVDIFLMPFRLWPVGNLFLAFLPLIFSTIIIHLLNKKLHRKWPLIILAVMWLLFLPNAFYYLTDLMWVASFPAGARPENTVDIAVWAGLMLIALGEFLAVLAGVLTLRDVHKIIASKLTTWKTWLVLSAIFLLSGFAIYMGRFLRLNSWDVLLPWRLVAKIFDNINMFALQFTLLMAVVIAVIYVGFWLISRRVQVAIKNQS